MTREVELGLQHSNLRIGHCHCGNHLIGPNAGEQVPSADPVAFVARQLQDGTGGFRLNADQIHRSHPSDNGQNLIGRGLGKFDDVNILWGEGASN